jgi:hypothetical protein
MYSSSAGPLFPLSVNTGRPDCWPQPSFLLGLGTTNRAFYPKDQERLSTHGLTRTLQLGLVHRVTDREPRLFVAGT